MGCELVLYKRFFGKLAARRPQSLVRSGEVVRLTEAHATEMGLYVARTKGSNDNIVKWMPRLRAAWDAALAARARILARRSNRVRPVPIRPEQRFILLCASGTRLSTAILNSAWQHLNVGAIEAKVIAPEDRFTLHGLKHRGITDTVGRRTEKKEASGRKSDATLNLYDHEMPVVEPARPGEAEGDL